MTTQNMEAKAALRAAMLARRDALAPEVLRAGSAAIAMHLQRLAAWQSARCISSYLAIGSEVRTQELIEHALARGVTVALPRTHKTERRLTLHRVDDLHSLQRGRFGLLEPPATAPEIDPAEIELFVVPGVAFDARGNRLGYGAGYYDHLLAASQGRRVALAFSEQLALHVPADAHDCPVELLVTEQGVINCRADCRQRDRLRLRNILCHGHHGAYASERAHGVRLSFDIDLQLDLQLPAISDRLEHTIDYPAIVQLLERIQRGRQFELLESLAGSVAQAILQQYAAVQVVTIVVRKFYPPVDALMDTFEVELTRCRDDMG